jgi:transglutaminase-like putative cysteine protease
MYSTAPPAAGGAVCFVAPRAVRTWIPEGDPGTFATLAAMAEMVQGAQLEPLTQETAARIVAGADSNATRARLLREWLKARYVFAPDPLELELVVAPPLQLCAYLQLGRLSGDCDDLATLAAALARAVHLPARFVVIALAPAGPFEHVWTEVFTGREWLELDLVADAQGIRPAQAGTRRAVWALP